MNICNRESIAERQTGHVCPNSLICWLQLEQQLACLCGRNSQVGVRGERHTTQEFSTVVPTVVSSLVLSPEDSESLNGLLMSV